LQIRHTALLVFEALRNFRSALKNKRGGYLDPPRVIVGQPTTMKVKPLSESNNCELRADYHCLDALSHLSRGMRQALASEL
jgi:hypothetical protein